MRVIARALAGGRLATEATGVDNLPMKGPALVVARHYHHLFDGLALFATVPRPFHIVVTLDWVRSRSTKLFMQTLTSLARWPVILRHDAVTRDTPAGKEQCTALFAAKDVIHYQRRALLHAKSLLAQGRLLVVFPEGYPNIDPRFTPKLTPEEFLPFKRGFVSIVIAAERSLATPLPIIPLGIRYSRGKTWVARLAFGHAIYRHQFADIESLVKHAESEVKKLSGFIPSRDVSGYRCDAAGG